MSIGSAFAPIFEPLFGGGGDGGGSDSMQAFLDWMMKEQERQKTLSGRELELSETLADYRRGELLDRSGYAGLVGVGAAVERSDATLAAGMAGLEAEDPTRVAYDAALAAEAADKAGSVRTLTGERYEAEDALEELRRKLNEAGAAGPDASLMADARALAGKYTWMDDADTLISDIAAAQRRAAELEKEREALAASEDRLGHGGP